MPRKKKRKSTKYTDAEKMAVVVEYGVTCNMVTVAKNLNMNRGTIKGWPRQDWWAEMVNQNRQTIDELVESKLTQIISLSHDRVINSLTEGDEKVFYNARLDKLVSTNILPTGKDAATIGGITFDKLRLIRNQPTRITSDSSNMMKLMDEFRELSKSYEVKNINTIEGKAKEIDNQP